MPNLGGFEVVGELTVETLVEILKGAWDNDTIPHSTNVPAGTAFGPYALADGVVNIPRDTLALGMDVPVNGVRITLPGEVQVEVANPPIPSARFFALSTDIVVRVPIGVLPGTIHVAALLAGIPRASVSATVTSGDPIPALTLSSVEEYVHARYADGTIPHAVTQSGLSLGPFSADAYIELYDDPAQPAFRISVQQPTPTQVVVRIPFHLRLSNLSAGLSPCGVVGKLVLTSSLAVVPGTVSANLGSAAVSIEDYAPAPAIDAMGDHDSEGTNYAINNTGSGGFLETAVRAQLIARASAVAQGIGNIVVAVPTLAQIEQFIADRAHSAIIGRGDIALWTPTPPPDGGVTVTDVRPLALPDAIAFCLNNPAGDTTAIVDFVPASRSCAIAIDGAKVIQLIEEQIDKPESEGGFGGLPHTFHDVDGHTARLTRLSTSLRNGSIHLEGDVTVIDAIADSIDVDASFEAEVGLEWVDTADGGQMLRPFVISTDVDLSLLAWILSFLLGFITLGLVGGIIALVIVAVAEGVAEKVGGSIVRDEITGQVKSIGAWPQQLEGIGTVEARFDNPVIIDPQSVMFPDLYQVTATFASVTDALAKANGPYAVPEGALITFLGGPDAPNTTFAWEFGDGHGASSRVAQHRYADDGLYVAKLTTVVHEEGGVVTRHFAAVRVTNVAASVEAGPPIAVNEGQVVEYVATFTDPGWPDTHTAVFDFGDAQAPASATVQEDHDEPMGRGTARASHAYCDDGEYVVTVRVTDDDGGVGVDTRRVTVHNVPPTVEAGEDVFAYPCTPITLVARFTDPGWCDTHVGTWNFGDCSPVQPATVRERHEPPRGCGVVAATHRYEHCGEYQATVTVVDDDGGVGRDTIVVRVVDVVNGGFEQGFRSLSPGLVANAWAHHGAGDLRFVADEFVVHGGQRAQRIDFGRGGGVAGLHQSIGANVGWDYQVSAWFHAQQRSGVTFRLGIDPGGGQDPGASTVQWSQGNADDRWTLLSVRATATARRVTLFLDSASKGSTPGPASAWFDDVSLLPYPCPLGEAAPCADDKPEVQREECIEWENERRPRVMGASFTERGFTFTSTGGEPLRIVLWGTPAGRGSLALPGKTLLVRLPFPAARVRATVESASNAPVSLRGGTPSVGMGAAVTSSGRARVPEQLVLDRAGMTLLEITGGREGMLLRLCVTRGGQAAPRPVHDDTHPAPTHVITGGTHG